MKKYLLSTLLSTFIMFVFSGCGLAGDSKEAEKTMEHFYDALKDGNVPLAASYCGTDDQMTTAAWEEILNTNINSMGNVTSYEKGKGFNVSRENRVSRVKLFYTVNYTDGKSNDSLQLVNNGEGFKLYVYSPELVQAKYQDETNRAESNLLSYYKTLQSGDHNAALAFVGYSGLDKHPKEEWLNFYKYADTEGGKITEVNIDKTQSKSYLHTEHTEAGMGNTYIFVIKTIRNNKEFTEHVDFFQPKYGDPLLIVAHNID